MKHLMCVLLVVCLASLSYGDLLAGWNVLGFNASTTPVFTNTYAAANISSNQTVLALGAGINASSAGDTFQGSTWTASSYANAVSSNDYISWFIVAEAGYQFTVTNVSFNFQRSGTGGSNMVVQSSYDTFSSDLFTSNNIGNTTFAPSITISTITDTDSVEFRMYAWSAGGTTGTDGIRNLSGNDLIVQGTIAAIPEPGTMTMLGLGLLALVTRRFRR